MRRLLEVADEPDSAPHLTFTRHLPLTQAALEFARERHGGQYRMADRAPFVLHPLEVASLLNGPTIPTMSLRRLFCMTCSRTLTRAALSWKGALARR